MGGGESSVAARAKSLAGLKLQSPAQRAASAAEESPVAARAKLLAGLKLQPPEAQQQPLAQTAEDVLESAPFSFPTIERVRAPARRKPKSGLERSDSELGASAVE